MAVQPSEPYNREYWVVPGNLALHLRLKIYALAAEANVTAGPSFDDAAFGAELLLSNKVVVWEYVSSKQKLIDWYNEKYPGATVEFRYLTETIPPLQPKDDGKVYTGPIGLHASTDPGISSAEVKEFTTLKAKIIKVLSGLNEIEGIRALAALPGTVRWVVRPYYSIGGRKISPHKFFTETIIPLKEALDVIRRHGHKDIVIEIHNEGNLVKEGCISCWPNGDLFAAWFGEIASYYRANLPGERFIYPGLSPGHIIDGVRPFTDVSFYKAARPFILNGDGTTAGYGVHAYWGSAGINEALDVIKVAQSIIGANIPFWVTEASDKSDDPPVVKAMRMVSFYKKLPAICRGVTFFAATSSDPEFAKETWVDKDMARRIRSLLD